MSPILDVTVSTTESYPIFVGRDLTATIREVFAVDGNKQPLAIAVIDSNVNELHWQVYNTLLGSTFEQIEWFVMPSGEFEKNNDNWTSVIDFALSKPIRRNTPLLSIGGGVTGDLAGFAAASIMRGLPLYHFPTTLLAMVDSSIGGKTGINHSQGKNLVGAFYQPRAVFVETKLLDTLPRKEWLCGLGEVLKYGGLSKPSLFQDVTELVAANNWYEYQGLEDIINTCIAIKADIVQKDEKEGSIRAFLNLGHTFAHALESYTRYAIFSHGEAVFIGLVAAAYLSEQSGHDIDPEALLEFRDAYSLDTDQFIPHIEEIMSFMYKDKKNVQDKIRLVLLTQWGAPYITEESTLDKIRESWEFALKNVNTVKT